MKRYKMAPSGTAILDTKTGTSKTVHSFEIEKHGKITIVVFNRGEAGEFELARHTIDETGFSLGPGESPVKLEQPKRKKGRVAKAAIHVNGSIHISKAELVELHMKAKELTEFLGGKIIETVRMEVEEEKAGREANHED